MFGSGIDVGEAFLRKTTRRDVIVSSARSDLEWFVVGEAIGSSRVGVGSCQCGVWWDRIQVCQSGHPGVVCLVLVD